jgi:uncharacterized membrane protein SirB2
MHSCLWRSPEGISENKQGMGIHTLTENPSIMMSIFPSSGEKMGYSVVKQLHITCVVISIALFILRGALQLQEKPWRHRMSLRIAPHVVDTLLLGSALWLAFSIHQYPFVNSWLTAKVMVLFVYILLAKQALGEHTQHRLAYFNSALFSVTYIVGVAISHSPTWGVL